MKNTIPAAVILTFMLAAARTAAAQEAAPADSAIKPPVQNDLPKAAPKAEAKPEAEAPAAKPEPKAAPKPEAKAEAEAPAAKPEPKAAPKPEAKPEAKAEAETPAVKPAAKAAPKPETAKIEPVKELNSCAKVFVPLADTYKKEYEEMQRWILTIDAETANVSAHISRIQDDIQKNEAAITKLKLAGGREGSEEGRELAKSNKQLWADLSAARKERTALNKGFAREAIQRAKNNQAEIIGKLEDIKAQAK
jgi:outer membrane biosynthesis protein TonB